MQKAPLLSKKKVVKTASDVAPALTVSQLRELASGWSLDGEIRRHSHATQTLRKSIVRNLLHFLTENEISCCGKSELRRFLAYLSAPAPEGGRWGNPQQTKENSRGTVETYCCHLKAFFNWCVAEGAVSESPLAGVKSPGVSKDQISPFTQDQLTALLDAAAKTQMAKRDTALILLIYDAGIRAAELCGLKRKDLDITEGRIFVQGKGDKTRTVYFGSVTRKALWTYLRGSQGEGSEPLFPCGRGKGKGNHLTPSGLRQLIERLENKAGVSGVRCSPHTFRHSSAVDFLRAGGTIEELRVRLGHSQLGVTLRYVKFAEADLAGQRKSSPADNLRGKK